MRVDPVPPVEVCLIAPRLRPSPAALSRPPPVTPTFHQVSDSCDTNKIQQHSLTQSSGDIHTTTLVKAIYFFRLILRIISRMPTFILFLGSVNQPRKCVGNTSCPPPVLINKQGHCTTRLHGGQGFCVNFTDALHCNLQYMYMFYTNISQFLF